MEIILLTPANTTDAIFAQIVKGGGKPEMIQGSVTGTESCIAEVLP